MQYLLALVALISFSGCEAIIKEKMEPTFELIEDLSEIQSDIEDAMTLSEDAVTITLNDGSTGYLVGECGVVTNDTTSQELTINLGQDSCRGLDDKERSGIIKVKYIDKTNPDDYQYSIDFQNYMVNGNLIKGKLTVNTTHRNQDGHLELSEVIEGGEIILKNGNTYTWSSERTREWVLGENTPSTHDDVFTISGFSKGGNENGTTFNYKIVRPLTFSRECWKQGIVYPIAGRTTVQMSGQPNRIIDWGLLICNKVVNVSQNGQLFILELK